MLDSKKIEERLALAASSHSERTLYIADAFGTPLSLSPNSSWYETVSDECVQNSLRSCTKSEGFKQDVYKRQASIFANGYIRELDLMAHEKEDIERLIRFMYQGE